MTDQEVIQLLERLAQYAEDYEHGIGELRARLALSQHSDPEGGTDG